MLKKLIYRSCLFITFLLTLIRTDAQISNQNDLALIAASENTEKIQIKAAKNRKRQFLIAKDDPFIDKINPMKWTLGGLLYLYQTSLSKHFSADCLYEPSCSNFSRDVIHHHGITKGVFLTADRLSRCNRIAQTDLHPLSINTNSGHSADGYSIYQFKSDKCTHTSH